MDDWQPGDQAMCIKSFKGTYTFPPDIQRDPPIPPSIYIVTQVCAPPDPPPGEIWLDLPHCYLGLQGKRNLYDSRHFKKLDPLPPEEIEREAKAPELVT